MKGVAPLKRLASRLRSDPEWLEPVPPPTTRQRLAAAVAIGVAAGLFSWLMSLRAGAVPDLLYPHTAARLFLDGQNPYVQLGRDLSAAPPYNEPFFYPFTAVLALLPLSRLDIAVACGLFTGIASGLLAWYVTRFGLWRIHLFASGPFVVAAALGQFAPLILLMAFQPGAGFLGALKPNLGLALFSRQPTRAAIVGAVLITAVSLVMLPSWPVDWVDSLRRDITERGVHVAPVLAPAGFLLLVAVVAWRRPAGRLLLALALIPQGLFFYDQLPLWLVPRTRNESIVLTGLSQVAILAWFLGLQEGDLVVRTAAPYVMLLIYIPALGILLNQVYRDRGATAATSSQSRP